MKKETFERVKNTYTLGTIGHIKDFEREIKVRRLSAPGGYVRPGRI